MGTSKALTTENLSAESSVKKRMAESSGRATVPDPVKGRAAVLMVSVVPGATVKLPPVLSLPCQLTVMLEVPGL